MNNRSLLTVIVLGVLGMVAYNSFFVVKQTERAVLCLHGAVCCGDRCQRHPQTERVGGHVSGVGQQRQRVRRQPDHDLDDEKSCDECEGPPQPAGVAGARAQVDVAVFVAHQQPPSR